MGLGNRKGARFGNGCGRTEGGIGVFFFCEKNEGVYIFKMRRLCGSWERKF